MTRNLSVVQPKPLAKVGPKLSRAAFDDLVSNLTLAAEDASDLMKTLTAIRKEGRPEAALALLGKRMSVSRMDRALAHAREARAAFLRTYDDEAEDDDAYQAAVSVQIAKLLGAYPNANPSDPAVYVGCMIEDVVAESPMLISLQEACQRLRKRHRFPPTVSEVLAVVAEVEDELWPGTQAVYRLETMAEQAAELRAKLTESVRVAEEQAAVNARLEAETRLAFPLKSAVLHVKYGLGEVIGHHGSHVHGLWREYLGRPQGFHIAADELLSVEHLKGNPQPGDRVAHFRRGAGTVSENDAFGRLTIDYDDGTCEQGLRTEMFLFALASERPALPEIQPCGIQVGQTVRHAKFGDGVVERVDGHKLDVVFEPGGRKVLLADFVKVVPEAAA